VPLAGVGGSFEPVEAEAVELPSANAKSGAGGGWGGLVGGEVGSGVGNTSGEAYIPGEVYDSSTIIGIGSGVGGGVVPSGVAAFAERRVHRTTGAIVHVGSVTGVYGDRFLAAMRCGIEAVVLVTAVLARSRALIDGVVVVLAVPLAE